MTKKLKCPYCRHDGQRASGGFQYERCWDCNGRGFVYVAEQDDAQDHDEQNERQTFPAEIKLDKRSKEYKEAIKKLQNKGMSKAEAEKLFQTEWERDIED